MASIPTRFATSIPTHIRHIHTNTYPSYPYQYRSTTPILTQIRRIYTNTDPSYPYQYISMASIPIQINCIHTNTESSHPYQHMLSVASIPTQICRIHTNTDPSHLYLHGSATSIPTQICYIYTNTYYPSYPYQYSAVALRSRFLFLQGVRIISYNADVFTEENLVNCSARLEFYWVYMEEK